MATLSLEKHISKTDAATIYRRGLRSLTRDIGRALASGDTDVLQNWRLMTKDQIVKQGTEVTTEEVESLHSQGMVPTWWGYEPYLETKYGRRDAPVEQSTKQTHSQEDATSTRGNEATANDLKTPQLPPLPENVHEQNELLKFLYLKEQEKLIKEEQRNEDLIPLIQALPLQQEQQTELIKGVHAMLAREQEDRRVQGSTERKPVRTLTPAKETPQFVEATEVKTVVVKDEGHAPSSKNTTSQRGPEKTAKENPKKSQKKLVKHKASAKKRAASRTQSPAKSKNKSLKPPTFAERHLPSLSRMFGSTSTKKK